MSEQAQTTQAASQATNAAEPQKVLSVKEPSYAKEVGKAVLAGLGIAAFFGGFCYVMSYGASRGAARGYKAEGIDLNKAFASGHAQTALDCAQPADVGEEA